ncbi:excisionase family DNA-binding protein [Mycobacterium canetti]|uniref:excisionase family DNA-binding protein n=1 Tax=Mycobacterium canetti TaxID=78331 RepID=UPI001E35AFB8|nr:excisionase family DNA-binding protein [Mycobacterium canetti]
MTVWLRIADAAEYAKLSTDIIRAAVKAGDLPSYAPTPGGRDVRLKAEDVDAWIESRPYAPQAASGLTLRWSR